MRVLNYFVAVYAAGQLASSLHILPQTRSEISSAVITIAKEWLYPHDNEAGTAVVEALKLWIGLQSETQLARLDDDGRPIRSRTRATGWQDDEFFYLPPSSVVKAIGKTSKLEWALSFLMDANILMRGGSQGSRQYRMGAAVPGRPYVYRISRHALENA